MFMCALQKLPYLAVNSSKVSSSCGPLDLLALVLKLARPAVVANKPPAGAQEAVPARVGGGLAERRGLGVGDIREAGAADCGE